MFNENKAAANDFLQSLLSVTRNVQKRLAKARTQKDLLDAQRDLDAYALKLEPWAASVVDDMILRMERVSQQKWRAMGVKLMQLTKQELLLHQREIVQVREGVVQLIKSIPQEASARVVNLAFQMVAQGERSGALLTVSQDLQQLAKTNLNRAKMIAVTESIRASNTITKVQAQDAGAKGFISRSTNDEDTCEICRGLNGEYISFANGVVFQGKQYFIPPYHPHCKCFPDPVFP